MSHCQNDHPSSKGYYMKCSEAGTNDLASKQLSLQYVRYMALYMRYVTLYVGVRMKHLRFYICLLLDSHEGI